LSAPLMKSGWAELEVERDVIEVAVSAACASHALSQSSARLAIAARMVKLP
jgi:hypothetical protein